MSNLTKTGYFFTKKTVSSEALKTEFQDYWHHLSVDNYIEDENKFRQRKYSHIKFDSLNNTIENIGSIYYQEEAYNDLFGGQHREFSPVDPKFLANPLFLDLLKYDFEFFFKQGLLEHKVHSMGVHQIRTVAKSKIAGKVTPEGVHKDGHPFFGIHLVNRQNINGGATNLYDNDLHKIENMVLENFGDTLLIEDDALYHEVTPVSQISEDAIGFRDVLIIEFY